LKFHVDGLPSPSRPSPRARCAAAGLLTEQLLKIEIREPAGNGGLSLFGGKVEIDFSKLDGLVAAVIQDHATGRVLMVGFMNTQAFEKTVETGDVYFFSRSRNKLWLKGETSGHRLVVKEIATDCDRDAVLIKVEALGPGVCHEGYQSCFFRVLEDGEWRVKESRAYDPAAVYGA
jgi:phosphoribosyl-AMP cyclohydrolase